jgi:cell division protein FtsW (lipid II flippase)
MLSYVISIIVIILALVGIILEIAATFANNKEDPKKINYYRSTIYIILLFWAIIWV